MGQAPSFHRLIFGYNNQYAANIDPYQVNNGISLCFPLVEITMFIKGLH
jgi:hypothetical protein